MTEFNNRFKVKKGLDVAGQSTLTGDLDVTGNTALTGNLDVTGPITTPTLADTENSTKVATTAFVRTAIANLIASSPATLDTLNEIAAALGNDPNFAATMTNSLALKAPLASPALTGTPTAPTASTSDNTTQIATTAFVKNQAYATLASPALTGNPTAPTAAPDTNTTQIATAAFVLAQGSATTPLMDGAAVIGTSTRWARADHVHPTDTSRAPLASPALTGVPTAPTATFGTSSTQLATTAFVQAAMAATGVGSDAAAIPGTTTASIDDQTVPTGTYYVTTTNTGTKPGGDTAGFLIVARTGVLAHQLYIDDTTSKVWSRAYSTSWTAWREVAYTDSPALTGTPTAPTASPNTNTTQVATTAYADAIAALKANIANPSFTGTASFGGTLGVTGAATFSNTVTITGNTTVGGGLASDDFVTIAFADDSNLVTTANQTGAIKIKLPVLYTTTQLSFTLSVNEGSSDSAFQMRISGHNRVSDNSWQFATATLIGNPGSKTPAIRYGNDGTTACIWIGELADVWTVPQIEVSNIHLGNSGLSATWLSGWAISFATTFDTVKTGPVTPFKTAGLASPAFTGTPAAPTANADTNTTQIATTAFVIGQASSTLPLINAVAAAIGTSLKYARADHVHPTDTTRAPVASPIFTGNPTAPTPADSDNSTSLATTAFVQTRLGFYAPLNSPALTGTPTAPTATIGDATTKIANTSFTQQTADNSAIVYSIVFG